VINSVGFSNALLEGARNCVVECGGVSEGMNVLILNLINDKANPVDDLAVHALATVCQEVGAKPQILWATGMEKGWWDDPSPIVLGAFREADLVINNTVSIGRPLKAIREIMFGKGVPQIRNMASTVEVLSSPWARIPFALTDEIIRYAGMRLDAASSWRVVSPNGTDIAGTFAPPSAGQSGMSKYATRRKDTKNRPFPQGCLTPITSVGANGVIVTDRTLPWEARHVGASEIHFSEPLRVTVENNRMVNFEGGPEAKAFRNFFANTAVHIGEDAWNLSSFHAGINPKARIDIAAESNPDMWHRCVHNHPSVLHFHLGGSKQKKEYDYPYMFSLSVEIDSSTLYLDGQVMYDRGRFTVLEDPDIRALASKYGDPDELLRVVELPPVPSAFSTIS
jgi:hypothetical protein